MAVKASIVSDFDPKGVRSAESAFGGLSKSAKVAGAAIAASFVAVTAALGKAVMAAAEDQQAFEKMAESIKKVTGATDAMVASTDKVIGKLALATGVADDQLRPALSTLVRATGDLGLSQKGLNTALDLSIATSNDLGTVSTALGKALAGNTTALVKMLPGLKGVIDNGSTAAEVLAAVDNVVGGAAAANAETFAGQMARLKVAFSEMVETVGSWLLPVLTQLAEAINTYVGPAMSYLSDTVGPRIKTLFDQIGQVVQEYLVPIFQDYLLPAFQYLADVVYNRLQPAIMGLYSVFVEKLGKAFQMIKEKLDDNRESFGKMRDYMDKVVAFTTRYLIPVIADLSGKYLDGLIKALGKVIDMFFKVADVVGPVMSAVGKGILNIVQGIVDGINAAIDGINFFIGAYNRLPGFLKPFGDVGLLPNIVLPTLDLNTYKPGGFGPWGENRGDMPQGGATGLPGLDTGNGPAGGSSGGKTGKAGGTANFGPQAPPSLGQGMGIGTGWDLSAIPFFDTPELQAALGGITVNVNGGLATSAEIGAAVVDAIRQFTNVSGPADIAVA
jgi:hypothetical protein